MDRINMNRINRPTGFTLVEILAVVVILGILAAMVVPQFVSAGEDSRQNSVKMDLNRIRQQLEVYKHHHNGSWPRLADFEGQMTQATNELGVFAAVGTPGYGFGPYLQSIPVNPSTGSKVMGDGAVGSSDWYYNEVTGDFHANGTAETFAY